MAFAAIQHPVLEMRCYGSNTVITDYEERDGISTGQLGNADTFKDLEGPRDLLDYPVPPITLTIRTTSSYNGPCATTTAEAQALGLIEPKKVKIKSRSSSSSTPTHGRRLLQQSSRVNNLNLTSDEWTLLLDIIAKEMMIDSYRLDVDSTSVGIEISELVLSVQENYNASSPRNLTAQELVDLLSRNSTVHSLNQILPYLAGSLISIAQTCDGCQENESCEESTLTCRPLPTFYLYTDPSCVGLARNFSSNLNLISNVSGSICYGAQDPVTSLILSTSYTSSDRQNATTPYNQSAVNLGSWTQTYNFLSSNFSYQINCSSYSVTAYIGSSSCSSVNSTVAWLY